MRPFAQVDVFTAEPGRGNPVAVVLDGTGLDTEQMQLFAAWTNLSETTFVLPPQAGGDYRVRIFTPVHELPFAGHPTIGTCRALVDAGLLAGGSAVQECAAGPVPLSIAGEVTFTAPVADVVPLDAQVLDRVREQVQDALGVALRHPLLVDSGPLWLTARVRPDELAGLSPDAGRLARLIRDTGWDLNLYAGAEGMQGAGEQIEVRSFFATDTLVEDPVCGSGNVAVAAHRRAVEGYTGTYRARQGRYRGRDGRITVGVGDGIRVGGHAVTVVSGHVTI